MKRTIRRGLGRTVNITVIDGTWTSSDGQSGKAANNKEAMADGVLAVAKKQGWDRTPVTRKTGTGKKGCRIFMLPLALGLFGLMAGGGAWLVHLLA